MSKRAGSVTYLTDADSGRQVESEAFTCGHCQRVTFVKHRERADDAGGLCKMCMNLICPQCVATGVCDPFEKKLMRHYERQRWGT